MNFTSHDIGIIERALKVAILHERDQDMNKVRDYREVLLKLEDNAQQALLLNPVATAGVVDGIRYDYDDSSEHM
ncbi:hypothetical protein D3C73_885870 [compost metagenome]